MCSMSCAAAASGRRRAGDVVRLSVRRRHPRAAGARRRRALRRPRRDRSHVGRHDRNGESAPGRGAGATRARALAGPRARAALSQHARHGTRQCGRGTRGRRGALRRLASADSAVVRSRPVQPAISAPRIWCICCSAWATTPASISIDCSRRRGALARSSATTCRDRSSRRAKSPTCIRAAAPGIAGVRSGSLVDRAVNPM